MTKSSALAGVLTAALCACGGDDHGGGGTLNQQSEGGSPSDLAEPDAGDFGECPSIVVVTAPSHAVVGASIRLRAQVSFANGEEPAYLWMTDDGRLAETGNDYEVDFVCEEPGTFVVTLTIEHSTCRGSTWVRVSCTE